MPNASKRSAPSPATAETHSESNPPAPAMSREEWIRAMRGVGQLPAQALFGKLKELFDRCPSPRSEAFDPAVIAACLGDIQKIQERHKNRADNPQDSVLGFVADQLKKNTGISVEDGNEFVAARLPIRRALQGEPIDNELLEKFDRHLFGMLRMEENRRTFPSSLEERVRLAVRMNDKDFFIRLGKTLRKRPASPFRFTAKKKGLREIKQFLCENWNQLRDCQARIGLCDLSWIALDDLVWFRFSAYTSSVRDLARESNLVKRSAKPEVKKVKAISDQLWQVDRDGKKVRLLVRRVGK